jgi:hypothetical protein
VSFIESIVRRKWFLPSLMVALVAAVLAGCATRTAPPAPVVRERPTPVPPQLQQGAPESAAARARHWEEYKTVAARRLVQANPTTTYLGTPPEPLLAIPVLEVELHGDGSVAAIKVQRVPSQATDTVQLAIDAVRRAAPFPPVAHLPKPWKYTEVFLFDDDRRFKPRTLD